MDSIEWPDKGKFALCLTHDVDIVKKTYQTITRFLKEKRFYHLKSIFSGQNPYWNFDKIIEIEDNYSVRSTFFFLNESKKFNPFKLSEYKLTLNRYSINNEDIVEVIRKLDDGGWEIGVHGSYDSFRNKDLLLKEKKELEKVVRKKVIGIRQHYLNLEIPNTWKLQKAVGFKYDASFGFRDKVGFRDNKFYPFRPFGDDFVVIPLTIMDVALFNSSASIRDAWQKCNSLIKFAKTHGALLTILWHNRVFNEMEFPGWAKIYKKIIEVSMRNKAWIARCKDVYNWMESF